MNWIHRIDRAIAWCFYLLFFSVPLIMFPSTYELFEFNKMWTVFGIALIILFLWVGKVVITGKLNFTRTPLDIPIGLFLVSQIISTIFSLDLHVSIWGYYSRFNGGFLSMFAYIFLYYAFASNLVGKQARGDAPGRAPDPSTFLRAGSAKAGLPAEAQAEAGPRASYKLLLVSLLSGAIVALWGFPSHFGFDPTCFVFRGTFDVSCWTEAFQPKVRIFSTLGQPNWLAAYLAVLIPISIAMGIISFKPQVNLKQKNYESGIRNHGLKNFFPYSLFIILASLFYVDLLWTNSQSGFVGFWAGAAVFILLLFVPMFKKGKKLSLSLFLKQGMAKFILFIVLTFLFITFFVGTPIEKLNKFTFPSLSKKQVSKQVKKQTPSATQLPALESSITGSAKIRFIVWRGALEIFKQHPLFGSGVETYAFSYYQVRPKEHNLTSEWDYLYNKAHNEYLNYLATTGIFGLGSYLLIIGWFLFTALKQLKIQSSKLKMIMKNSKFEGSKLSTSNFNFKLLTLGFALIGSYVSILVSNFFGFSVVIINLFFFFIPLLFYNIVSPYLLSHKSFTVFQGEKKKVTALPTSKMSFVLAAALIILYFEFLLFRFWLADQTYALGYNLDRAGDYLHASDPLEKSVSIRPGEYLYKDELSSNLAILALFLHQKSEATQAAIFATQAKTLSDEVITHRPNNLLFYKTRTRVFYSLAQIDPSYMTAAIEAIEKAHSLAPTDAKILYNMALLYHQVGKKEKGIEILMQAISLRPNYRDAYYALALFYTEMLKEEKDLAKTAEFKQKAVDALSYSLANIEPNDPQAKELLESLK